MLIRKNVKLGNAQKEQIEMRKNDNMKGNHNEYENIIGNSIWKIYIIE